MRQLTILLLAILFSITAMAQDPTETHVNEATGLGYVIDHEGNIYRTAKFGDAGWWMTQNLATKSLPSSPNTPIPFHTVEEAENPRIAYPQPDANPLKLDVNDIPNYERNWGMLYNWASVMDEIFPVGGSIPAEGPQGICPTGWHVPTDTEWDELEEEMAAVASHYSNGLTADGATTGSVSNGFDGKMGNVWKSIHLMPGVAIPTLKGQSISSFHGGLNILLVGAARDGRTINHGKLSFVYSSTSSREEYGRARAVSSANEHVHPQDINSHLLASVRCKKDDIYIRTNKNTCDLASGHDNRAVAEVVAAITSKPSKAITVSAPVTTKGGGVSFSPALVTSLPATGSHNFSMTPVSMATPIATSPWQSNESKVTFSLTTDDGIVTSKEILINQTNYALKVNNSFSSTNVSAALTNPLIQYNFEVQGNATWKASLVNDTKNIIEGISTEYGVAGVKTVEGGEVIKDGNTKTQTFYLKAREGTGTKYQSTKILFEDTETPKRFADISVGVKSCLGTEDRTQLAAGVSMYTDARDGEQYLYRTFGTAGTWMLENMRATNYATNPGAPNPSPGMQEGGGISPHTTPWWAYPKIGMGGNPMDDVYLRDKTIGLLYNWSAATGNQNTSLVNQGDDTANALLVGVQGICPPDWHLPSDVEWNLLEQEIANNPTKYSTNTDTKWNDGTVVGAIPTEAWNSRFAMGERGETGTGSGHGNSMKAPCGPLLVSTDTRGLSLPATEGGFAIQLAGMANDTYGHSGSFWTSSFYQNIGATTYRAWYRTLRDSENGVGRHATGQETKTYKSVRCKKD